MAQASFMPIVFIHGLFPAHAAYLGGPNQRQTHIKDSQTPTLWTTESYQTNLCVLSRVALKHHLIMHLPFPYHTPLPPVLPFPPNLSALCLTESISIRLNFTGSVLFIRTCT